MIVVGVKVVGETAAAQTEIAKVADTTEKTARRVQSASKQQSKAVSDTADAARKSSSAFTGLGGALGTVAGSIAGAGFSYLLGDVLGLPGPLQNVITAVGGLAPALIESAGGIGKLASQAGTFAQTIGRVTGVTRIATAVQTAWNAVTAAFPGVIIILAILAVIAVFVLLYTRVAWFRNAVNAVLQAFAAAAVAVFNAVIGAAGAVIGFFSGMPGRIGSILAPVASFIFAPYRLAWSLVTGLWSGIGGVFSGVVSAIGGAVSGVFDVITSPFRSAYEWVKSNVFDPLRSAWNGFAGTLNNVSFSTPAVSVAGHEIVPSFAWHAPWHIPMLATGGVFDRATLAMVGEGAGREIVTPERLLRQIVATGPSSPAQVNLNVSVQVAPGANRAEIGRETVASLQAYIRANGPGAFARAVAG